MTATGRLRVADRLAASGGRPAGFDYLRLLLAMGVILLRSVAITRGIAAEFAFWVSPWRPFIRSIMPMFFALSGFLVAGSFERSRTIWMFFGLRVIRIYPALLVEVVLSAFILGVIFTALPLSRYFSDPLFHRYLLNMLGDPHYDLPGVFLSNPYPLTVNGQLWTVPYELGCYLTLGGMSLIGARRRPIIAPLAAALMTIAYIVGRQIKYHGVPPVSHGLLGGPLLVISFLVGVSIYVYRERLPMGNATGIASVLIGAVMVSVIPGAEIWSPWPLAYATVYLGTTNPKRIWLLLGADYSYGLFLYGYPIQQALAALLPGQSSAFNTIASILVAGAFAAVSWRYVEKPALRLRGPMTRLEDHHVHSRRHRRLPDELASRPLS